MLQTLLNHQDEVSGAKYLLHKFLLARSKIFKGWTNQYEKY